MIIDLPDLPEANVEGRHLPDSGVYRASIMKVETKYASTGTEQLEVNMRVMEGPEQQKINDKTGSYNPAGLEITDWLSLTPQSVWRVKQLMVCAGLIAKDDKTTTKLATEELVGCPVNIEVYQEPDQNRPGKFKTKVSYLI